ncbi:MAG TPA: hypothetical protein PKN87_09980 [Syntrophomonadaceae bacterium]|nr:hypothetical protein [Syntrophomonadaceae bacterium]HPR92944.1 hypothetical protein [Syntrophomonadaceae bacterium]
MTLIKAGGHGEKASRKQDILICALLSEPTIELAAKKAGIGSTTAYRWMQDSEFLEEYQEARRLAVANAIGQLHQTSSEAVATLRKVMLDNDSPPASRVSAAKTILDLSLKAVELEDLAGRINRIEQSLIQD